MRPDEVERQALVEAGAAVLANRKTDEALIAWAKARDLYVYIGRPGKWGNPFEMDPSKKGTDRDQVCDLYREHLDASPGLRAALPSLRGKVLGCWCYPLRCHGNELIRALEAHGAPGGNE